MNFFARMWDDAPSITVKFIALLIPALAITSVAFCSVYYYHKFLTLHSAQVLRLEAVTDAHAEMLASSMWAMDDATTRVVMRSLAINEGVVCVEAADDFAFRRYSWPEGGCPDVQGDGQGTATATRNLMNAGRRFGGFAVHYNDATLRATLIADVTGTVALVLLVLLATVATAVAAHGVAIARPLRSFIDSITQAERHQARSPVSWRSSDEMGRVIAAYNRLVARLAEDEKALENERSVLQATLDNIGQGVLMVDGAATVILFNRRAAEYLEVSEDFLGARPRFTDVVKMQEAQGAFADSIGDFDLRPDVFIQLQKKPVTFKRRRSDGAVLEVRSNPLADGGFVRTLSDVTAEARASSDMVRALQDLEAAYSELKTTQDNLIQAEKMASLAMLVAGVAHEINTPVGIAYGCATHLSARTRELADAMAGPALKRSALTGYVAHASESARLIQQNLSRAADLIQSFKQVAVDQTSQERRSFDLAVYLGEIITSLQPRLRYSPHRVTLDCPAGVKMDSYPGALSQIITNLVMNALTHAFDDQQAGHITVSVAVDDDGEWLTLSCADDGRGVAPEHLSRIFEPFFTTRRGVGGSGLGLHIVYNLASQTLGGRITAENPASGGACFTIRLPRITPVLDPVVRPAIPDTSNDLATVA